MSVKQLQARMQKTQVANRHLALVGAQRPIAAQGLRHLHELTHCCFQTLQQHLLCAKTTPRCASSSRHSGWAASKLGCRTVALFDFRFHRYRLLPHRLYIATCAGTSNSCSRIAGKSNTTSVHSSHSSWSLDLGVYNTTSPQAKQSIRQYHS